MTNEENRVEKIIYNLGLGKSDHLTLMFDYICFIPNATASENKNTELFQERLHCLSRSWTFFAEKLVELTEQNIPVSKVRDGRHKKNPYVTNSGLEAIKKKHTRWLKYQYCKTPENYTKYKQARNLGTAQLRRGKGKYNNEKKNWLQG